MNLNPPGVYGDPQIYEWVKSQIVMGASVKEFGVTAGVWDWLVFQGNAFAALTTDYTFTA